MARPRKSVDIDALNARLLELAVTSKTMTEAFGVAAREYGYASGKSLSLQVDPAIRDKMRSSLYQPRGGRPKTGGGGGPVPLHRVNSQPMDIKPLPSEHYPASDEEWDCVLIHRRTREWNYLDRIDPKAFSAFGDFLEATQITIQFWRFCLEMVKQWHSMMDIDKVYVSTWFKKALEGPINEQRAIALLQVHEALGEWLTRDTARVLALLPEYNITPEDLQQLVEARSNGTHTGGLEESNQS